MNFEFQIVSKKHGTFTVTAPERFRDEIEARTWCVMFHPDRAKGRQFAVATKTPRPAAETIYLHRYIWQLAGHPPASLVDHIDGQPLNNAENNLRDDNGQNQQNSPSLRRHNTTGARGIYRNEARDKWEAFIGVAGRKMNLGRFDDIKQAQIVRDIAALMYHGAFAVLNAPSNDNVTPEEYRALLEQMAA